jgi:RNA recognition motif-containing protein
MQVKKHLKNGKNVSMGFGFIEFDSVETAINVCRDLQVLTDLYQNYLHAICSFGNLL